jgi:methylmalonyl-CoA mutase
MTKAVASGLPKMRIEEAAARRQALVDSGQDVVVGVNKYRPSQETEIDLLYVDNAAVLEAQVRRLGQVRAARDASACETALKALEGAARGGGQDLLALSIEAARARATVGEISLALEKVFTRHQAVFKPVSGVYLTAYEGDEAFVRIQEEVAAFAAREGRRPRMLIAKLGQDGHDRGAHVVASAFADMGFDVDIGPLFQTPEEAARQALENDVHVVGVSSLAGGHRMLVPQLIEALRAGGADDVVVACGGIIPPDDREALHRAGVAAFFGPGSNIPTAAREILGLIGAGRR